MGLGDADAGFGPGGHSVNSLLTVAAILLAWLGAATVVVSDGRKAVSLGLALTGCGLGGLALLADSSSAAVVLLAGGLGAGALRLRDLGLVRGTRRAQADE